MVESTIGCVTGLEMIEFYTMRNELCNYEVINDEDSKLYNY